MKNTRDAITALAVFIWAACCIITFWASFGTEPPCEAYEPCPVPTVTYEAVATSEPTPEPTPEPIEAPEPVEEPDLYREDIPLDRELQAVLREVCVENEIPFEVGVGLIDVESDFTPTAVSPSGCYGLCQLNPRYFPSGLSDEENIRAGVGYLGEQLKRYGGDMAAALQSYHDGHDTGKRWYANAVLSDAEYWRIDATGETVLKHIN